MDSFLVKFLANMGLVVSVANVPIIIIYIWWLFKENQLKLSLKKDLEFVEISGKFEKICGKNMKNQKFLWKYFQKKLAILVNQKFLAGTLQTRMEAIGLSKDF